MGFKNIVPRVSGEGSLGTEFKKWAAGYFLKLIVDEINTEKLLVNGEQIIGMINLIQRQTQYNIGDVAYSPLLPSSMFLRCTVPGTTAEISPEFSPNATVGMTYTDGGVTWTLDSYLPTSGGEIRDRIKFPIDDGNILDIGKNRNNNHMAWIRLLNSGQTDGVGIYFRDSADETCPSSIFIGSYNNGEETMKIWLRPDLQTINNKPIVLSIDGKNADNSGNIALNVMTYKKLSSIKSVKGCFWADSNSGIDVTQIPAGFTGADWNLWQIGMLTGNDKTQFFSNGNDIFIRGDDAVAGAESWTQSSWERILTGHNTADYIVTNYNNGTTWYQKYYSGKIIQGGLVTVKGSTTVTFPVAFKTNVQSIQLTHYNGSTTNNASSIAEASNVSLTKFVPRTNDSANSHQFYWLAVGR